MRMYLPPEQMKNTIAVGRLTVGAILIVSLFISIYYWYQIAGVESMKQELSLFEKMMLYSAVATGVLSELVKKVTLSTFRNMQIWLLATVVSVLTMMGSYAILDQNRSNTLKQASDSYQDSRATRNQAKGELAKYAYLSGTTMAQLQKEQQANIDRAGSNRARRKSGASYQEFKAKQADIAQRMAGLRAYLSAKAMIDTETEAMTTGSASGGSLSNPLFGKLSEVMGFTVSAITLTFFLAVTILLEVSAYWIGGEVEEYKNHLHLTEAELQDLRNVELFGVSFREIQQNTFKQVIDAQLDQKQADIEIMNLRKLRLDDQSGKKLSSGDVSQKIRGIRANQKNNHQDAIGASTVAGELDLEGYTLEQLDNRRKENIALKSDNPICPACNTAFQRVSKQDVYCCPAHRTEFNNQIRRLRRANT